MITMIKKFNQWLLENRDLDRLGELGLANPFDAAQSHLMRISAGTQFPISRLERVGEEGDDFDTDEVYFVVEGPNFQEDEFEEMGIDWSLFSLGITPDGEVSIYYDASPLAIASLHSEEDARSMSQALEPVPVAYDQLRAEDWEAVCKNIVDTWGEEPDENEDDDWVHPLAKGEDWYPKEGRSRLDAE